VSVNALIIAIIAPIPRKTAQAGSKNITGKINIEKGAANIVATH